MRLLVELTATSNAKAFVRLRFCLNYSFQKNSLYHSIKTQWNIISHFWKHIILFPFRFMKCSLLKTLECTTNYHMTSTVEKIYITKNVCALNCETNNLNEKDEMSSSFIKSAQSWINDEIFRFLSLIHFIWARYLAKKKKNCQIRRFLRYFTVHFQALGTMNDRIRSLTLKRHLIERKIHAW